MKLNNFLILFACFLFYSCQKEPQNDLILYNAADERTQSLTENYKSRIFNKAVSTDLKNLKEDFVKISAQLEESKSLKISKNSNPILLEDLFIVYNGTINTIHGSPLIPEDDDFIYEYESEIPVVEVGLDSFAIEIQDYNTFYSEMLTNLGVETQNGGYLHSVGFELLELAPPVARIKVKFFIGIAVPNPPVFAPFPQNEWYYTGKHEDCNSGLLANGTYDAADVLDYYMKQVAFSYESCISGTFMKIYLSGARMKTDEMATYSPTVDIHDVYNFLHNENSWQCIGDNSNPQINESEWLSMKNDAKYLFDKAAIGYTNNGNIDIKWLDVDIWSFDTFQPNPQLGGVIHYRDITQPNNPIVYSSTRAHVGQIEFYITNCI